MIRMNPKFIQISVSLRSFHISSLFNKLRHNDPKFSDRQAWANSADPDQTAPWSSLIRVYTVCNFLCIFWTHYSKVKPPCSTFRAITANFPVSKFLGVLQ